jgi:hypothetical protein
MTAMRPLPAGITNENSLSNLDLFASLSDLYLASTWRQSDRFSHARNPISLKSQNWQNDQNTKKRGKGKEGKKKKRKKKKGKQRI